jgi:hypothetical protein
MEWNRLSTDTRRLYTGGMRIQISLDKPEAIVEAMARKFYVEKVPESTQRAKIKLRCCQHQRSVEFVVLRSLESDRIHNY